MSNGAHNSGEQTEGENGRIEGKVRGHDDAVRVWDTVGYNTQSLPPVVADTLRHKELTRRGGSGGNGAVGEGVGENGG